MDSNTRKVIVIGAGNVASHLARAVASAPGYELAAVVNRGEEGLRALLQTLPPASCTVGLPLGCDFSTMRPDIVVVSVPDGAIASVAATYPGLPGNPLCLLTSGTVGREALASMSPANGTLYPLQSFTKGIPVNFKEIPIFTDASTDGALSQTDALARALSDHVYHADAEERRTLHIAGVFSNNFVNILLEKTREILAAKGLPLDIVRPLVENTVLKAFTAGPRESMTGPARRGDKAVMRSQHDSLPAELQPVYEVMSRLITETFSKEQ